MELLEGIETRRSIRGFASTPVPEATLRQILRAANCSPSYTNTQPWEVAVVTGAKCDALRQILHERASSGAPSRSEMPAPSQWPADLAARSGAHAARRFQVLGIGRDDAAARTTFRLGNYTFFGAPCVLFLFMDAALGPWSTFDMGLFTQNLALAAHGLGLGTCLQASLTHYPDTVRGFLGLPGNKKLMLGVSLGFADPAAPLNRYQSARKSLDEFVTWHA